MSPPKRRVRAVAAGAAAVASGGAAAPVVSGIASGAAGPVAGGWWSTLWPFPAVVSSAFLIAWGAECAQFMVSQGMALAILAWLQALPEFAVEAVIAWSQQVHFMTANFTGSLRLLVGLGWPLIFGVAAYGHYRRNRKLLVRIHLDEEHCVEVLGLAPPIAYFLAIYAKSSLTLFDAGLLMAMYVLYLWVLTRIPPREAEEVEDLEAVPRAIMRLRPRPRGLVVLGLFVLGGWILYEAAEPFLHSMLGLAVTLGVSEYLFIQWVAPFLSEFPEKLSAIYWARQRSKAPMALMNMVSANVNQWTMLAAMIPIVYSFSLGHAAFVPFDANQKKEILLTVAQSLLGMLLLANMSFHIVEATGIFVLWGAQFLRPTLHEEITVIYFGWAAYEIFMAFAVRRRVVALQAFAHLWRAHGRRAVQRAPATGSHPRSGSKGRP